MKLIILITSLMFLANCSTNSVVKLGKKCTKIAAHNTYEKSFIWIVDKKNIETFGAKINKEICKIIGEKS